MSLRTICHGMSAHVCILYIRMLLCISVDVISHELDRGKLLDCEASSSKPHRPSPEGRSVQKESVQDNVIRGTFKVSLTLSGRSPEPTPTKPNDLLGCCWEPGLSNRPQMPPTSRHVCSGGSYLFSSRLLNPGFQPVGASPARGRVLERVTGG